MVVMNLFYILDILGHLSIQTTDVCARADSIQKRETPEKAYVDVIPETDREVLGKGGGFTRMTQRFKYMTK